MVAVRSMCLKETGLDIWLPPSKSTVSQAMQVVSFILKFIYAQIRVSSTDMGVGRESPLRALAGVGLLLHGGTMDDMG